MVMGIIFSWFFISLSSLIFPVDLEYSKGLSQGVDKYQKDTQSISYCVSMNFLHEQLGSRKRPLGASLEEALWEF